MRFLHTSDWHLGRSLRGFDLHDAQVAAADGLVDAAIDAQCDAFIIAGDVFDRAFPPPESIALFSRVLTRLHSAGIATIVIAGNHDSGIRLAAYSELLTAGVHIVGDPNVAGTPIVIADAHVYPLPYLNPDEARTVLADEPLPRSHQAVMSAAMDRVRTDVAARAHPGPVVAVAHAFVAGGAVSESERDIAVGGVPVVASQTFDGMDYVALGHLHRPQQVHEAMQYPGSLLRYSASEAEHTKRALLVDVSTDGVEIEPVEIEQPRPMIRLSGTMAQLLEYAQDHGNAFVELTVTDERMPEGMIATLRNVYPFAMQIRREVTNRPVVNVRGTAVGKSRTDVVTEFLLKTTGTAPTDEELAIIEDVVSG